MPHNPTIVLLFLPVNMPLFTLHQLNQNMIFTIKRNDDDAALQNLICIMEIFSAAQNRKLTLYKTENIHCRKRKMNAARKRNTLHKREYRLQKTENGTLFRASIRKREVDRSRILLSIQDRIQALLSVMTETSYKLKSLSS